MTLITVDENKFYAQGEALNDVSEQLSKALTERDAAQELVETLQAALERRARVAVRWGNGKKRAEEIASEQKQRIAALEAEIEQFAQFMTNVRRWLLTGMYGTDFHKVQAFMEIGKLQSDFDTAEANPLPFEQVPAPISADADAVNATHEHGGLSPLSAQGE